jgi:hypothetical protein
MVVTSGGQPAEKVPNSRRKTERFPVDESRTAQSYPTFASQAGGRQNRARFQIRRLQYPSSAAR